MASRLLPLPTSPRLAPPAQALPKGRPGLCAGKRDSGIGDRIAIRALIRAPILAPILAAFAVGAALVGCRATPPPEDPRELRASALSRDGEWEASASTWTAIYLDSGARNINAGIASARALAECGRYRAAELRLIELDKRLGRDARVDETFGLTLEGLGRPGEAIDRYEASLDKDAGRPLPLRRLGALMLASGDVERGLDFLQRAVSLDPSSVSLRAELGLGAARAGRFDLAAPALDRAIRGGALSTAAIHEVIERFAGDPRAIPWLSRLVSDDPQDARALGKLGRFDLAAGRTNSGLSLLERAAASEPGDVDTLLSLAEGLLEAGRPARAAQVLEHAEALDLTSEEAAAVEALRRRFPATDS